MDAFDQAIGRDLVEIPRWCSGTQQSAALERCAGHDSGSSGVAIFGRPDSARYHWLHLVTIHRFQK